MPFGIFGRGTGVALCPNVGMDFLRPLIIPSVRRFEKHSQENPNYPLNYAFRVVDFF